VKINTAQFEIKAPSQSRSTISFVITIFLATFLLTLCSPATAQVKTSNLGNVSPTFVGPAATGCASGCALLTGPVSTPATAPISGGGSGSSSATGALTLPHNAKASPPPILKDGPDPAPPSISCEPAGPGCEKISSFSGGAIGVKGLNAVDNGTMLFNLGNPFDDNEPPDQGLCAGNGYVVESNSVVEILVFNTALQRQSLVIPLDTVMGHTALGWSSGGDISCA
jgi:hypothetical protein